MWYCNTRVTQYVLYILSFWNKEMTFSRQLFVSLDKTFNILPFQKSVLIWKCCRDWGRATGKGMFPLLALSPDGWKARPRPAHRQEVHQDRPCGKEAHVLCQHPLLFPGCWQGADLEVEHLEHDLVPVWAASTVGGRLYWPHHNSGPLIFCFVF